jgi:hypothetical protein
MSTSPAKIAQPFTIDRLKQVVVENDVIGELQRVGIARAPQPSASMSGCAANCSPSPQSTNASPSAIRRTIDPLHQGPRLRQ